MHTQKIICPKRDWVLGEKQFRKKESEEEKSVGKRKEKAKTRREVWEREVREAKKAWKNEKAQEKKRKIILFYS